MKSKTHASPWIMLIMVVVAVVGGAGGALAAQPIRSAKAGLVTPPPISTLAPFNNEGISADATPTVANFDGGGASYSNDALTAAGYAPGQSVTVGSYAFQWVNPIAGKSDNWLLGEQTIPISTSAGSIAFLGSASGGNSTGTAFARFSDGSVQSFALSFSDWTLGGGSAAVIAGNTIAVATSYRNLPTGKQSVKTYIFETTVALTPGKTLVSVTLPRTVNQGWLHVFAVATPISTTATLKGITNDSAPTQANLDGSGHSYSSSALYAAGLAAGLQNSVYGFTAQWPVVAPTTHDTWGTYGAVMPLTGSGNTLAILGAAVNGASSGTATITYADGTIQTFTLAFSDWTLGGSTLQRLPTNYVVAVMPYRNSATGKQLTTTYVFATMVGLWPGKALKSLKLPTTNTGGRPVVFAAAAGTANIPFNLAAISSDLTPTANIDGGGRSYSNNALAAAGLPSGASVASNGFQFQWPTNAANGADAWQSAGQVIPVMSNGASIGFLGAAANGAASGSATVTYTDGTTSSATISLSDWTLGGGAQQVLPGDTIVAKLPYRNASTGQQVVATYIFFTSIALTPGKTAQSVTLPSTVTGGRLDIFAVSGTAASANRASDSWPTYLGNPGHTNYAANETTLTAANAAQLQLKWTAHAHNAISDQPVFGNGLMYWGSWDGLMHATNTTGTDVWTRNIGQQTVASCVPQTAGVASTATVGSVGGTPAVFIAGGNHTVYALNAATGAVIWANTLTVSTDYFIWDSPVVYNGSLYLGISSFGDCPLALSKIYQLNLSTGAIQNTLPVAPQWCPGDGVWGSPTVDVKSGVLFFATGNGCAGDPNASAIEAVSTGDLSLVDRWQVPAAQLGGDSDFGNTPTLFTAVVNGVTRQMIGVASKNGYYYALDRTHLGAGPIWSVQVAVGGDCPDCGDGSISPSAWDGTTLYVAGGNTTINGAACSSSVSALNPATGAFTWQKCLTTGPTLGAVLAAPGLVIADSQTTVNVLDAATGNTLFQYQDTSQYGYFFSAPALNNGMVYAANADGSLYAFGL